MRKFLTLSSVPYFHDLAYLILRLTVAFFMAMHGYDKFLNFMSGSADFPDPLGVGARASLGLTVFAELFCSILLGLGLLTRLALIPLIICTLVIVFSIHWNDPLGDKEHALLYLLTYVALFFTGAGKYSLDQVVFKEKYA